MPAGRLVGRWPLIQKALIDADPVLQRYAASTAGVLLAAGNVDVLAETRTILKSSSDVRKGIALTIIERAARDLMEKDDLSGHLPSLLGAQVCQLFNETGNSDLRARAARCLGALQWDGAIPCLERSLFNAQTATEALVCVTGLASFHGKHVVPILLDALYRYPHGEVTGEILHSLYGRVSEPQLRESVVTYLNNHHHQVVAAWITTAALQDGRADPLVAPVCNRLLRESMNKPCEAPIKMSQPDPVFAIWGILDGYTKETPLVTKMIERLVTQAHSWASEERGESVATILEGWAGRVDLEGKFCSSVISFLEAAVAMTNERPPNALPGFAPYYEGIISHLFMAMAVSGRDNGPFHLVLQSHAGVVVNLSETDDKIRAYRALDLIF